MTHIDPALERARKRARELRDFYGHLITYLLVNALLVVIDLLDGSGEGAFLGLDWAYWPIIGWGAAVVIHAVNTMFTMRDWEERKAKELYDKDRQRALSGR